MQVTTIEGTIENGQIKLPENFDLPENTTVYIIIPNLKSDKQIASPKLVNKSDMKKFEREVFELNKNEV